LVSSNTRRRHSDVPLARPNLDRQASPQVRAPYPHAGVRASPCVRGSLPRAPAEPEGRGPPPASTNDLHRPAARRRPVSRAWIQPSPFCVLGDRCYASSCFTRARLQGGAEPAPAGKRLLLRSRSLDRRPFRVVARRLRGQPALDLNRLEIDHPGTGFGPFLRVSCLVAEKSV